MESSKFYDRYRFTQFIKKAEKYVKMGAEWAEAVIDLADKPKKMDFVNLGLRVMKTTFEYANVEDLEDKDWQIVWEFSEDYFELIKDLCTEFQGEKIKDTDQEAVIVQLPDNRVIAFVTAQWSRFVRIPIKHDVRDYMMFFGQLAWKRFGSRLRLTTNEDPKKRSLRLIKDFYLSDFSSRRADEIAERVMPFIQRGINRSILLHGRPGTGKSCLIRNIAERIHGLSLSVNVDDLATFAHKDIMFAIDVLRPDVLIIDDFDRHHESPGMLESLEKLNLSLKLMIVTANEIDHLGDAILRPGRFDEIMEVNDLGEDVTRKLTEGMGLSVEQFQVIRAWPAAYVEELRRRILVLGRSNIDAEFASLAKRLEKPKDEERPENEDEDAPTEKMPKVRAHHLGNVRTCPGCHHELDRWARDGDSTAPVLVGPGGDADYATCSNPECKI